MKTKYYYDCPIKALYMMREFGVNFSEAHGTNHADKFFQINESELCDFATGVIEDFRGIEQIYVASESEHIFEPKNDDFGIVKNFNPLCLVRFCSYYNSWNYEGDEYEERFNNDEIDIIYRNDKHFFNPKEEN